MSDFIPLDDFTPLPNEPELIPTRPRQRPTYSPVGLGRQFLAGAAQVPADVTLGLPGLLGVDAAARNYRIAVDNINNFVGVEDPRWREDLPGFLAREVGSAFVGLPAAALSKGYQLVSNAPAVVRAGLRGLEAVTPLTLPLTRSNIAINAVGGAAVGAGFQELAGVEEAAREAEIRATNEELQRQRYSGQIPAAEFTPLPSEDFVPLDENAPRTWQGRYLPMAGAAAIALGGTAVGALAYRSIRQEQAARAAQDTQGIVSPGPDPNSVVREPTAFERFNQNFVSDATVFLNEVNTAQQRGAITPTEAAELRATASRTFTEAPLYDTITEALDTGIAPLTGQRIMSAQELEIPVSSLSPQDKAEYDALIAGANELDNRAENLARNNMATYNGQTVPARVNMWDIDDQTLMNRVHQYYNNPRLRDVVDAYRRDADNMLDFMVATGLKTRQEVTQMQQVHPHYMFTMYSRNRVGVSGDRGIMNTTESNTPTSGRTYTDQAGSLRAQDPISSRHEAWRKVMAEAMVNDAMRKIAKAAEGLQQTLGPMEKRAFGRVIPPQAPARDGFAAVPFTDVNGKPMKVEVSKEVLELIGSVPRASAGIFSGFSTAYRSFTTGPLGALLGSVMAPVSAGMASMATAINRPREGRAGVFDTALKRLTNDRVGVPGDVSFFLQTTGQALADLFAQGNQWVFQAAQRSHMNNGVLTKALGQQGILDLMRWTQKYYEGSNLAAMRRSGATGTGLGYDPTTHYTLNPGMQLRTPELRQKALSPNSIQDAGGLSNYVVQMGGKITPVQAQRAWDMWTQALDIISSSAASAYFRLNRGRGGASDAVIAAETRGLAGDPSAMGANKLWQQALSMTPYANITLQSIASMGRKAKNDPAHFIPSLLIATTAVPLLQVASAIFADKAEMEQGRPPKYVAHMLMQNSNHSLTDMRMYIPGVEPQFGFRITPDHTVMPAIALTQAMLIQLLGADKPEFWSAEMAPLRDHFVEFMSDRTERNFWSAVETAYGQVAVNPLIAGGVEAATGTNIQNSLNMVNPNVQTRRDVGMPGYEDRQGSNDPWPRVVRTLVTNFAGAAADTILSAVSTASMAGLAEGGEPVAAALDDMTIRATGNLRQAAPLLQQQRRLTQRDAVGDVLADKEKKLEAVYQGLPDITRPDTVGAGNATRLATGVGRQPPPADIEPYVLEAGRFYSRGMLPEIRRQRSALQQDILSIENDPQYANNPQLRLRVINERVEQIRQLNQMMYVQIQAMESDMSRRSGRRFSFERLDPQRGLDQFPALR